MPNEFRRIGRQQLEPYNNVETRRRRSGSTVSAVHYYRRGLQRHLIATQPGRSHHQRTDGATDWNCAGKHSLSNAKHRGSAVSSRTSGGAPAHSAASAAIIRPGSLPSRLGALNLLRTYPITRRPAEVTGSCRGFQIGSPGFGCRRLGLVIGAIEGVAIHEDTIPDEERGPRRRSRTKRCSKRCWAWFTRRRF